MAMPAYVAVVAGAPAPGPHGAAPLGPVAILLGTIVLLLGIFALGAVLLARSSHRRPETGGKRPPEPPTDAWREAGRRLTPPEAGDET